MKQLVSLENEIWVDILELNSLYQISNLGRVISKERKVNSAIHPCGHRVICARLKTLQDNGKGYIQLYVMVNKKRAVFYVHRLVAKYFTINPDNKNFVNHINGIKYDNRSENLEWVTHQENINHAKDNNLISKGEQSGTNKLKEIQVLEIRRLYQQDKNLNKTKLAKQYGVRDTTIHKIINRQRWQHI